MDKQNAQIIDLKYWLEVGEKTLLKSPAVDVIILLLVAARTRCVVVHHGSGVSIHTQGSEVGTGHRSGLGSRGGGRG